MAACAKEALINSYAAMITLILPSCILMCLGIIICVAAFRFRPRYLAPKRIKQDRERQVVEIEGVEFPGEITDTPCGKCGEFLIYHNSYDEYYCPICNEWANPAPTDPVRSRFKRPDRPLPYAFRKFKLAGNRWEDATPLG